MEKVKKNAHKQIELYKCEFVYWWTVSGEAKKKEYLVQSIGVTHVLNTAEQHVEVIHILNY